MTEHNNKTRDKHVKISADRHQQLKILSAKTGREMREILEEAFDEYMKRLSHNKGVDNIE